MRRLRRAATRPRFLAIYLNDHLAGATGGVALAERAKRTHRAAALRSLTEEIKEDRRTLMWIMSVVGVKPARHKAFAAWASERVASLKTNGRLFRRSPLSALLEIEALYLGVHGKAAGWRTLLAMTDHVTELDPRLLRELLDRAQAQLRELEDLHNALARELAV